jgi:acetyl-CoA acetyltransferase family protein
MRDRSAMHTGPHLAGYLMRMSVSDAFITAAVRTPIGRAGGALADIRPDDLAAAAILGLVRTASLPADRIEDVILGCANQAGEDNRNVARMAALLAGLPVEIPGQTVNRLCGSGLQAAVTAAHAVRAGEGDLFIAGGVESMTRAPYVTLKSGKPWDRTAPAVADSTVGWRFVNPNMRADWTISLGETAERVATIYRIDRAAQDAFAVESQRRAQAAIAGGAFADEIVGIEVRRGR